MAASSTAVPSPNTDGGNALAALLAAAAASMHRQQHNLQQHQLHASVDNTDVRRRSKNISGTTNKRSSATRLVANLSDNQSKGPSYSNQTIQQQLESKRDTLCQLLNLKPATLIDSSSANCSLTNEPPSTNHQNKRSTSTSPSSVQHMLSSKSKMEMLQHHQHHNQNQQQFSLLNGFDKLEKSTSKNDCGQQQNSARKQNGESKTQMNGCSNTNNNNNSNNINNNDLCYLKESVSSQYKRQATCKISNTSASVTGTTTTKTRSKTNHKSSTSSSSSISTSTDKDSINAAKLLVSLINGNAPKTVMANEVDNVELRNLESWHDEDEIPIDDNSYQELVDPSNSNGWSADEMFKYNEKMHKITSSYNEKTLSDNYTTPLPKINSKTTMRLATQLAREIEERVLAEGRITPESSDDDELFEQERRQRVKLRQQKQLDQLKNCQRTSLNRCSINHAQLTNVAVSKMTNTTKSSSQYSNSTETPATASLSSSPTLNDTIKPVTSSSRNILRTCLT